MEAESVVMLNGITVVCSSIGSGELGVCYLFLQLLGCVILKSDAYGYIHDSMLRASCKTQIQPTTHLLYTRLVTSFRPSIAAKGPISHTSGRRLIRCTTRTHRRRLHSPTSHEAVAASSQSRAADLPSPFSFDGEPPLPFGEGFGSGRRSP